MKGWLLHGNNIKNNTFNAFSCALETFLSIFSWSYLASSLALCTASAFICSASAQTACSASRIALNFSNSDSSKDRLCSSWPIPKITILIDIQCWHIYYQKVKKRTFNLSPPHLFLSLSLSIPHSIFHLHHSLPFSSLTGPGWLNELGSWIT